MASRAGISPAGSSPRTRGTGATAGRARAGRRFIPAHAGNSKQCRSRSLWAPVHPRARGEQCCRASLSIAVSGSSPRTRGTVERAQGLFVHTRFIPAHAGNRVSESNRVPLEPVHPRARGEQLATYVSIATANGSSPRTRGTGRRAVALCRVVRFIPAHAGNSGTALAVRCWAPVHPRARGEQGLPLRFKASTIGSSPRTRGTGSRIALRHLAGRFIPAHAGNRPLGVSRRVYSSVHPRARGEQLSQCLCSSTNDGSSPRTRGTVHLRPSAVLGGRFIPAHAGNSLSHWSRCQRTTVHPRARGEQPPMGSTISRPFGSSPRTRGTVGQAADRRHRHRFIPAHAGNSAPARARGFAPSVHPRARGEQLGDGAEGGGRVGSSPRTRGTENNLASLAACCRFIPAHAGNRCQEQTLIEEITVHPRARGEQAVFHEHVSGSYGSSPRTRGTEVPLRIPRRKRRFIPAHAGNSARSQTHAALHPVHPRARGEQSASAQSVPSIPGSSPRTRGTARPQAIHREGWRFIPAHAGNSRLKAIGNGQVPVHPRARGEQVLLLRFFTAQSGSSPRTRGTVSRKLSDRAEYRFIPAHAGNRLHLTY